MSDYRFFPSGHLAMAGRKTVTPPIQQVACTCQGVWSLALFQGEGGGKMIVNLHPKDRLFNRMFFLTKLGNFFEVQSDERP